METPRLYFLSVPVLIAVSMLSGCGSGSGQPTNISYRQIGICKGFTAASGPVTSKADEGYAIFKIETVDNTKSNKAFAFDPKLLYVDQSTPEQHAKQLWEWDRRYASTELEVPAEPRYFVGLRLDDPGGRQARRKWFSCHPPWHKQSIARTGRK